jgi:hypothetical protein
MDKLPAVELKVGDWIWGNATFMSVVEVVPNGIRVEVPYQNTGFYYKEPRVFLTEAEANKLGLYREKVKVKVKKTMYQAIYKNSHGKYMLDHQLYSNDAEAKLSWDKFFICLGPVIEIEVDE